MEDIKNKPPKRGFLESLKNANLGDFTPPESVDGFDTKYSFLSNFSMGEVCYEGMFYPTVEHAYQALKIESDFHRLIVSRISTPQEVKVYVRNFLIDNPSLKVDLSKSDKLSIMKELVREKFTRNAFLGKLLVLTKDSKLIEKNDWKDEFWGVCNGKGENHLGKILMKVREELKMVHTGINN